MKGIGQDLTIPQQLACMLRVLAPTWQENLAGHITWAADDGSLYCNPWGIWWSEVTASDIVRVAADGGPPAGHRHLCGEHPTARTVDTSRRVPRISRGKSGAEPENRHYESDVASPMGHDTPVPPMPQYPPGFLPRYCWWYGSA